MCWIKYGFLRCANSTLYFDLHFAYSPNFFGIDVLFGRCARLLFRKRWLSGHLSTHPVLYRTPFLSSCLWIHFATSLMLSCICHCVWCYWWLLCSVLLLPPWHWLSMYAYEKVGHYQNKPMPPNIYYCIAADYNDVSFHLETFSIYKIVYVVILIQALLWMCVRPFFLLIFHRPSLCPAFKAWFGWLHLNRGKQP